MKHLLYRFGLIFIVTACVKTEPVSPVPHITYKSITTSVDEFTTAVNATLTFDFIDGDADIGYIEEENDTLPDNDPSKYVIFLTPFEKVDSVFNRVEADTSNPFPGHTITYNDRLNRVGQNRTIKGTITYLIQDNPVLDSMRYEFYIRDRAGHISNTEVTRVFSTRPR